MAASYPGAVKSFSAIVNGVTKLVAALFNSPYDEITAIETELGTNPKGLSADVKTRLNGYNSGWFAVAVNTTYTKTHSLGTRNVLINLQFSTASDYSAPIFNIGDGQFDEGLETGFQISDLNTSNIEIKSNNTHLLAGIGGGYTDTGCLRVLMLPLE